MAAERASAPERMYRFAPLDRTGWMLGLGGTQCLVLGAGIIAAGLLLQHAQPAPLVLGPVIAATLVAFGSWERRSVHEWAPVVARHLAQRVSRRSRWHAAVPLLTGTPTDHAKPPALPPFLDGLELLDAGPQPWSPSTRAAGMVVVRDHLDGTVSASIPVRGQAFALVERGDQERIVQHWGDALAGFCTERGCVSRIRVTEWSAPAGVAEHERFVSTNGTDPASSAARRSYDELLAEAGPMATRHEVLVTVTVDQRRVRGRRGADHATDAAVDLLGEELRLLTSRLEAAGLEVCPPLSAPATAEVLRLRLDPGVGTVFRTRAASLAEMVGLVSPGSAGPLATDAEWGLLRVDGSCHRTYWIAEWPRLDVAPNWLEPVLLQAGGTRTFALHYEPVAPSRSQRRIDRDSTRLASDEEQRSRAGFRIGARHRRAQAAVLERESELVAGYAELEYAGFVTVTADDPAALVRSCAEYEQVAAQAGLELRALDGRHDLGVVCSLPVGRGLAPRRFA